MIQRLFFAVFVSMLVLCGSHVPANAQVAVYVAGSRDDIAKQWYRYQQYLSEAKTAYSDYQQFLYAYDNYKKYKTAGLVSVITPLTALQHDIDTAMHDGKNPHLAAELKRNTYVLQNVQLIDKLTQMNHNAQGSTQVMQVTNTILATLAADTMQQREVDYAKARAQQQREANLQALRDADNAAASMRP